MQDGTSNEHSQTRSATTDSVQSRRQFLSNSLMTSAVFVLPALVHSTPELAVSTFQSTSSKEVPPRTATATGKHIETRVQINQVGFETNLPKRAVVSSTGLPHTLTFSVIDDAVQPKIRYRGKLKPLDAVQNHGKFNTHFEASFDNFEEVGRYRIRLSNGQLSPPFTIGHNIDDELIPLVMQYFDIQRCGVQQSEFRGSCHVSDGIVQNGPDKGRVVDCSGGWHDAGDFMKFVETTSYVAAVMLFAYDLAKDPLQRASNLSESDGKLPHVLAQAKIGLDWLLKMHPEPNVFYYQVGQKSDHDTWRLPESDADDGDAEAQRRTIFAGVGANLAGRTAAAFALAARLYEPYDVHFSEVCLAAAQSVFRLGLANPQVVTTEPADFYPEATWADDMEWGAIALFDATGRREYLQQAVHFARLAGKADGPVSVYNVHAIAHYSLYRHATRPLKKFLRDSMESDVYDIAHTSRGDPHGLGIDYTWGTSAAAAGAGVSCILYGRLEGDTTYHHVAHKQRDFILGCNPFGLCCLVGAGTRYPLFPHSPVANLRDIELTGAVVGGPADKESYDSTHTTLEHTRFFGQNPSPVPADDDPDESVVYHDVVQDYVTNEPANDYAATFFLLTALELNV